MKNTFALYRTVSFEKKLNSCFDIETINDILNNYSNGKILLSSILSVFPLECKECINRDDLSVIDDESILKLSDGEEIYYYENMVYFTSKPEEPHGFNYSKGKLIITNHRIIFRDMLDKYVDLYDVQQIFIAEGDHDILIIESKDDIYYMHIPEARYAYMIFKRLSDLKNGRIVRKENICISTDELTSKCDILSCIDVVTYIANYDLTEDVISEIERIITRLHKLNKLLELDPKREVEIQKFLSYYIPETISIINSYKKYVELQIDEEYLKEVYDNLRNSVNMLSEALDQKIKDIIFMDTMNTNAKASALKSMFKMNGLGGKKS